MPYKELRKVFYTDPSRYEEIYLERFHSEYAHYVPLHIGEFPAFFITTPDIGRFMLDIVRGDKAVWNICNKLPPIAIDQFSMRCLIDEIVLTNNIEGVHSTRREIGDTLTELQQQDHHSRFYGIVQKYLLLQNYEHISLSTCANIRSIYDDLVSDEIRREKPENLPDGEIFRKDQEDEQSRFHHAVSGYAERKSRQRCSFCGNRRCGRSRRLRQGLLRRRRR